MYQTVIQHNDISPMTDNQGPIKQEDGGDDAEHSKHMQSYTCLWRFSVMKLMVVETQGKPSSLSIDGWHNIEEPAQQDRKQMD